MYLLELAKERGYYFLNIAEALMNTEGYFDTRYSSDDGLHWNDAGRDVYINYVLRHPIPGY